MALPGGVTTCTVTYGTALTYLGGMSSIAATLTADRSVVWAATGVTLNSGDDTLSAADGLALSFDVPHVDQAGFVTAGGSAVTDWYYTLTGVVTFATGKKMSFRKNFQVFEGQTNLDLDTIADDATVLPAVVVVAEAVTSVDGQTGAVDLSSTYAPLAPEGAFLVFATDDTDVADAFPQYAWLILDPPDTTDPSVPTGLAATPGDEEVDLDWSDSTDNVAVTGYRVYRDGVLIGSPATSTYSDTGLTNGTTYDYTVSAIDAAGNESAQCAVVEGTPAEPIVTIASDDFNRANTDTGSGLGTTSVGAKVWTSTGFKNRIQSNVAECVGANGSSTAYSVVDSAVANHSAQVKLTNGSAYASGNHGAIVRYVSATEFIVMLAGTFSNPGNGGAFDPGFAICRITAANDQQGTVLGTWFATPANNDVIKVSAVGTAYKGYVNGVERISVTNGTHSTTATSAGIFGSKSNFSCKFDDFVLASAS